MADYRYFIKVHVGFPEHRKTAGLSDRAFRVLVELWCLTARVQSDGVVTKAQLPRKSSKKVLDELASYGWLTVHDSTVELLGYLEHQTSKAAIDDLRKVRAEAGKRGGTAKAKRVASATANGKQRASKPVPEVEVETEVEKSTTTELPSSAAPKVDELFAQFWAGYPRKVGKEAARKAFRKACTIAPAFVIISAARRYGEDPNLPEQTFIPHPATWLSQGRWDDGPQATRPLFPGPGPRPTLDDKVAGTLARAEQLRAAEDAVDSTMYADTDPWTIHRRQLGTA